MLPLTVITVSYNAEDKIEKTIQSVIEQTFLQFEYIIVDGESTDRTLEIAKTYEQQFRQKGIDFRIIHEPDNGIYDAMNKGIRHANGDWLLFMNAGDELFQKDVLSEVFQHIVQNTCDIYYGDAVFSSEGYYKKVIAQEPHSIPQGMFFCHQSTFTRREIMTEYLFNTDYRIGADWNFFLSVYQDGYKFQHIDCVIAFYEFDGVSSTNIKASNKEGEFIRKRHNIKVSWWKKFTVKIHAFLAQFSKKHMKRVYYSKRRGWYKDLQEAMRD